MLTFYTFKFTFANEILYFNFLLPHSNLLFCESMFKTSNLIKTVVIYSVVACFIRSMRMINGKNKRFKKIIIF